MEDAGRNTQLGEVARDAALERSDFLISATEQLNKFMERHAERLRELGGLVLIDDDPEYLAVAPDGSFRSRSRYQDETTGEWLSETEVIESVGELVELYNPADIYAAFAEAAREEAGLGEEPTAAEELVEVAGLAPDETVAPRADGIDPYAGAADDWAARQEPDDELPDDDETGCTTSRSRCRSAASTRNRGSSRSSRSPPRASPVASAISSSWMTTTSG
jgi:hypothetical protein